MGPPDRYAYRDGADGACLMVLVVFVAGGRTRCSYGVLELWAQIAFMLEEGNSFNAREDI